jgi:hypothetical protein
MRPDGTTRNRPELPPIKTILDAEELAASAPPAAETPAAVEGPIAEEPASARSPDTASPVITAVATIPADPVDILRDAATKGLLQELEIIESETVRSAERLVATQRVIAGLPSTITEHRVAPHAPERTPEELAQVSVSVLEAIGRMDQERDEDVIDVEAT